MSRLDCTCVPVSYWHEPHCDTFWPDDHGAENHLELMLDTDREDSL